VVGGGFQQGAQPRLHRWLENGGGERLIAPIRQSVFHARKKIEPTVNGPTRNCPVGRLLEFGAACDLR